MKRGAWADAVRVDMNDDAEIVVVAVLLATVILRVLLVGIVVWMMVPRRQSCPQCSQATVPVLEPTVLRLLRLERRWCMACGWNGIARKGLTVIILALAPTLLLPR